MNVGSDTFPRDEVTGLAAFDHLDPVSTVSTLSMMPELAHPPPRVFTPPPPPMGASVPPPPRARVSATPTLPPPAAHAARTFSRPAELPGARFSLPPTAAVPSNTLRADATEVVDLADADSSGGYESWEDPDDAATRIARPMSDGRPAPSAELQMDWDEDEPPTQMRGEGGVQQPRPVVDVNWDDEELDTRLRDDGSTSAYQPAPESGRPSPFPSSRPSVAGVGVVTPSVRSGAPSPFVTSESETAWGQELRGERPAYWIIGAAAVAIVGAAFALRAFFASPTPALITLTTVPSTATVIVDGKPVAGSSSPFTATDLAPGVSHELVVQKDGFVEQRTTFTLQEGESKTLPAIKLAAVARDVGFVISSSPEGAEIRIDGEATGQVTPARITKVSPGLHKLELVHAGYAPFELQAFVPENEVLELPSATLVASANKRSANADTEAPNAVLPERSQRSSKASSRHSRRERSVTAAAPNASKRVRAAAAPKRAKLKAAAPASGKGILRVNSRPWAQVFVDGKLMGNTPQMNIQLAPGDHKVKLVNGPMGLTKSISVNVKNGQTVTKVLNLIE